MAESKQEPRLEVVEICAGAGGQTLGLERAGFRHRLAVELDPSAANTLRHNLEKALGYSAKEAKETVRVGDAASLDTWNPADHPEVDLLAGGVPCPPFSIAGKQLGANDERDLFAWAVELCGQMKPKALLLENVRGLSANRFTAYRQHVLDRLRDHGYIAEWKLLQASDYGVSQLRPRFVLVALREELAPYFVWPKPLAEKPPTVGNLLKSLMASGGWEPEYVEKWVRQANDIAPTIVGGSKKHGGADLGPTRAKRAWRELGVDALGVADGPPREGWRPMPDAPGPKLTTSMVARIQGWESTEPFTSDHPAGTERFRWEFLGRKTSVYRQIGNAFPPPVALAVGQAIRSALLGEGEPQKLVEETAPVLDPVYKLLQGSTSWHTVDQIITRLAKGGVSLEPPEVERHLNHLSHDFAMEQRVARSGAVSFRLGQFKAFLGQEDHLRHDLFTRHRSKIS
jgi:DNA (cytosine-5)-methyltransferase 1